MVPYIRYGRKIKVHSIGKRPSKNNPLNVLMSRSGRQETASVCKHLMFPWGASAGDTLAADYDTAHEHEHENTGRNTCTYY